MKSIDPNVVILAGSLLGSDIDYLNETYKSGLKDNMVFPYLRSVVQMLKNMDQINVLSQILHQHFGVSSAVFNKYVHK
jgi:hypothetical protein